MTPLKAAEKFSPAIETLYMSAHSDRAIDAALALPGGTSFLWRALNLCPPNDFSAPPFGQPRRRTAQDVLLLHTMGLSDPDIAHTLGVHISTVYYHRKKLNLPPNATRRPRKEATP